MLNLSECNRLASLANYLAGRIVKTVADASAPGSNLVTAYSRKFHSGHGLAFDLPLNAIVSINNDFTVQRRAIGNGHEVVFKFDTTITSVMPAAVTDSAAVSPGNYTPVVTIVKARAGKVLQ